MLQVRADGFSEGPGIGKLRVGLQAEEEKEGIAGVGVGGRVLKCWQEQGGSKGYGRPENFLRGRVSGH